MLALTSSLAFVAAAAVASGAVVDTVRQNRSRITAALRGRPLERVRPVLHAAA